MGEVCIKIYDIGGNIWVGALFGWDYTWPGMMLHWKVFEKPLNRTRPTFVSRTKIELKKSQNKIWTFQMKKN